MSNWPLNAEVLQGIARTSFYNTIGSMESDRLYAKICKIIPQSDLTTTYTSFGEVPEPRQLSGTVASTGERQARGMKDYKVTGTVVEWEQTVEIPRAVIETNPQEIAEITQRMARKAMLFMDRRFIGTTLDAATTGYDGLALYSTAHAETGASQDNARTTNIAIVATPTGAEIEASLAIDIGALKGFTDDRSTPVNEGVASFDVLVPLIYEYQFRTLLEPLKGQIQGTDVSGGTGKFRGLFNVYASAFVSAADRYFLFARNPGTASVALLKNKDFEFVTNIGTDSDTWRHKQMAVFSSYARFEFIPWDWKCSVRQVYT